MMLPRCPMLVAQPQTQAMAADTLTDPPKSPTPATGSTDGAVQNPPPRPPGIDPGKGYAPTPSACEPHRDWIEEQVRLGRNATAIVDLAETDSMPTAIFAFNDLVAAGALSTLEAAGLRVPDDVSVVGYDNTFIAELNHMSLTTINQPRHQMGQLAIRTVLERIEDDRTEPTHIDLAPTLSVRRSTAPPRKA